MLLNWRLKAAWRILRWPTVVIAVGRSRHSGGVEAHNERVRAGEMTGTVTYVIDGDSCCLLALSHELAREVIKRTGFVAGEPPQTGQYL